MNQNLINILIGAASSHSSSFVFRASEVSVGSI